MRGGKRERGPETPEAVLGRLRRAASQPEDPGGGPPWRWLLITVGALATLAAAALLAYFTAGGVERSGARTPPPLPPIPPAGVYTGTTTTTPTPTPKPRTAKTPTRRVRSRPTHTRPVHEAVKRVPRETPAKTPRPTQIAISHFVLASRPTVTAGAPYRVTVTAAGTGAPRYSGWRRMSGGRKLRFVHGRASVTVRLFKAGPTTVSLAGSRVRVTVVPAEPARLAFRRQPADATAGRAITVAVEIDDRYGNLTASNATAAIVLGGRRLAQKHADAGVATFTAAFTSAGRYVLSASSAGLPGARSNAFKISAAPARRLVFTTGPATLTAGATSGTFTVRRQDQFGNLVTSGTTTVKLASTSTGTFRDGGDTMSVTSVTIRPGAGKASFRYRDATAGRATITASAAGVATATQVVTVAAATAAKLTLSAAASTSAGAGSTVTVTALDALGNVATGYDGDRPLTFSGAQAAGGSAPTVNGTAFGSPTTLAFSAGRATGVLKLYRAETDAITVSDGSLASAGVSISVAPASASSLSLASASQTAAAGASTSLSLAALDPYGNLATGYEGARSLTFAGASVINGNAPTVNGTAFGATTTLTFSGGRSTGAAKLYRAGAVTITASDGSLHSNGVTLTVHAGAGARLAWTGPPSVSSGSLSSGCEFSCTWTDAGRGSVFTATVTVLDAYGNVATDVGSATTITFGRSSGGSWSSTVRSLPTSGPATTGAVTYTTSSSWNWQRATITASAPGLASATVAISRRASGD